MVTHLDVRLGQLYTLDLPETDGPILVQFAKEMRDGRLMFRREGTDREIYVAVDEFECMRTDGRANRSTVNARGEIVGEHDIEPLSLLDPDDPNITLKERDNRLRQHERLRRARTLRFYTIKYDNDPVGRGRVALRNLISVHFPEAFENGYDWRPSPSTLLRSIDEHGSPGDRPLTAFILGRFEHDKSLRWPKDILDAANEAVDYFWSDSKVSMGKALYQFRVEADSIVARYALPGIDAEYPVPCDETVRLWIRKKADWWNWAQRYGSNNASRRFRGRGRNIDATRPLEYVMMDHTEIDAWSVVIDDDGEPLFVARGYLTMAIDCYSRMVLGAILSFEPPSVHSVTACLKQVVRRNSVLIDCYGEHKGATDGWGRPFTVIVDNGKDFVSPSFQAACEAAGIDVIWAPIKTPMFKPYVERLYGTINSILWHDLPGGLPLTPQERKELELEPEAEAVFTNRQLEEAFWNAIVTLYHVEEHSGIGMAPALKWRRGIAIHKRATVDDVGMLDKFMGRSKMVQLSAEGVNVHGHRFHDQETTTQLMNALAHRGKERQQRRGVTSTRTVQVRASWDPGDASKVNVWNPVERCWVSLPNWDSTYARGLSWHAAEKIKEFAKQRNMAFHSDSERAKARIAHRDFLLDLMPGIKAVERRRRARILEPLTDLVSGDRVEIHEVDHGDEIQHDTAARRANHTPAVPKGRPFGGKAGTKKAANTRKRNAEKRALERTGGSNQADPVKRGAASEPDVDANAIQARVLARLQSKNGGN